MTPRQIFRDLVKLRMNGGEVGSGVKRESIYFLAHKGYHSAGFLTIDGFIFIQEYQGGLPYKEYSQMEDRFIDSLGITLAEYSSTLYKGNKFKPSF